MIKTVLKRMPNKKFNRTKISIIVIGIVGVIAVAGVIFWQSTQKSVSNPSATVDRPKEGNKSAPVVAPLKVASDGTLGSQFAVVYPNEWTNVHTGAPTPQSTTGVQTDENTITSPSGAIRVMLTVQTNAQTGGACRDGYIQLKYLQADAGTLPAYNEGRFAAYVVYFPSFNLYQYHVGLQKNTDAIRGVTVENNTACNFMFSEFMRRDSSLPGVPPTMTKLSIKFVDLVANGQDLKAGVDETEVAAKLSGPEYEQAKAIVRSVHILK